MLVLMTLAEEKTTEKECSQIYFSAVTQGAR